MAGKGRRFDFHGSFATKADAKRKERATRGAFIERTTTKAGVRYLVLVPRGEHHATHRHRSRNRFQLPNFFG